MIMVLLSTILSLSAVIASNHIHDSEHLYYALFLLLETSLIGVFVSFDLFLFYIFWELVLVPMYFLIAVWGGPRRKYAAIKFFIYTHVGSVIMLISFFYVYWQAIALLGIYTFNLFQLIK
ncbi:MAG TPA: Fe-S-binding domain-containing protein, partial [Candidatus Bathyarchaeota archaeon]|nr:Fe-S-binding domain-containing protein [Candidatus Bathyarchaeota archaeon]